ncbi:MAG TPA: hypothetical protein VNU19_00525 [Candidatus Acidoferrum sp.]|nr:hypothetical protein [Candidatus Acidoferrum sp.]
MSHDVRRATIFVFWYLCLLLVAFCIVAGLIRGDLVRCLTSLTSGPACNTWAGNSGVDLHNIGVP